MGRKIYILGLRRKRNLRSIYFDRHTQRIGKASDFWPRPVYRQHRYLFIGQYTYTPTLSNKRVQEFLKSHKIRIRKTKYSIDNLPF